MPVPPLAHLGHWYVSLPVFMGPVLLLAIALKIQTWREDRQEPGLTGKRSTVAIADSGGAARIVVGGPLDYPALLEIETQLGLVDTGAKTVLDLCGVSEADRESAWTLCEAIDRARARERIKVVITTGEQMRTLRTVCAQEGIELLEQPVAVKDG